MNGRVAADDAQANWRRSKRFCTPAILTLARFGNWDAVLAEPAPPADLRYATGMWHYARGLAHAAQKDVRAAEEELAKRPCRGVAASRTTMIIILNPAPALLKLAAEVLAGDIAARQQRFDDAVAHLKTAIAMEDALTYDEPPPWYHSVRNRLGDTLLASRTSGGGGRGVPRRSALRPGDGLVAVGARARAARGGQDG